MRALKLDEIYGFLEQSNISKKNIRRLEELAAGENREVALLADLVRRVALVHPRKRKRWSRLQQQHSNLFHLAKEAAMIDSLEPERWHTPDVRDDFYIEEVDFDGWIEPAFHETEPAAEELRAASPRFAPF